MNEEIKMMVNAIMEEMGKMEDRINYRFDKIEQRLDMIQHEVNACK